jgi:hypothetical protein
MSPVFTRSLFVFLVLLSLSGCVSSRQLQYTNPSFRPAARPAMDYATPLSAVRLMVGEQVPPKPDWFLSGMVARDLKPCLLLYSNVLNLQQEVLVDSLDRPALQQEMNRLLRHVALKSPDDSLHAPLLQEIVQSRPQRYTLLLLCDGITRTADNYARASARSARTTAMYGVPYGASTAPVKAKTRLSVIVYDRQRQQVVYARASAEAHEPTSPKDILRHLQRLLGKDFGFTAELTEALIRSAATFGH